MVVIQLGQLILDVQPYARAIKGYEFEDDFAIIQFHLEMEKAVLSKA